jgi:hypothetical protein
VVFVFEGRGIERLARDLVDDPVLSAAFSIWARFSRGLPFLRTKSSTEKPASDNDGSLLGGRVGPQGRFTR